ncbi:hypothetical protein D3C81_1143280 [compost metagenome]
MQDQSEIGQDFFNLVQFPVDRSDADVNLRGDFRSGHPVLAPEEEDEDLLLSCGHFPHIKSLPNIDAKHRRLIASVLPPHRNRRYLALQPFDQFIVFGTLQEIINGDMFRIRFVRDGAVRQRFLRNNDICVARDLTNS